MVYLEVKEILGTNLRLIFYMIANFNINYYAWYTQRVDMSKTEAQFTWHSRHRQSSMVMVCGV